MTCFLNTYGRIANLESIIKQLNQKSDQRGFGDEDGSGSGGNAEKQFVSDNNDWLEDWSSSASTSSNVASDAAGWSKPALVVGTKSEKSKGDESSADGNSDAAASTKASGGDAKEKEREKREPWYDALHLSFSPCGNLIAIGSKQTVLICQGKWDINGQICFSTSSRIDAAENEKEMVTAVLCIPIASERISGEGLLEWTCIMVGFSTGNIRMYTENGTLLITQMFHDESVLKLKCRTYEPAKYIGWISQPEEVEIIYKNNVLVTIDGANLYYYLRAARKYAANFKNERGGDLSEMMSSLNLDYKKWKWDNQETLADVVSAGLTCENKFDQLFSASMIGGPSEMFESVPPTYQRYIVCGYSPFVSYYYAAEGFPIPVLHEVKAVAGKVTSALVNVAKYN